MKKDTEPGVRPEQPGSGAGGPCLPQSVYRGDPMWRTTLGAPMDVERRTPAVEQPNAQAPPAVRAAQQALRGLRPAVHLAEEVGAGLGAGEVLLGSVSGGPEGVTPIGARERHREDRAPPSTCPCRRRVPRLCRRRAHAVGIRGEGDRVERRAGRGHQFDLPAVRMSRYCGSATLEGSPCDT